MNKYKSLLNDTFIFALGSIGSKFIMFFLVPIYTNYMTTEQFGVADMVFTLAQLIIPFSSVVIYDAVLRFGLSKNQKKENVLLISLLVECVGIAALLFVIPILKYYQVIANWRWYLYSYISLSTLNTTLLNYLKVKNKNMTYAVVSLLQTLCIAVFNIYFLVFCHLNIKGYLLANIFGVLISIIIIFFVGELWKDLRNAKIDKTLGIEMLKYSFPLIFNNISWWVVQSSDKFMIQIMLNASAVGIYTVAAKIPALINVMISVFSQAWGVSTVREMESSNDGSFYSKILQIYSFFSFGASLFLVSIVKFLMPYYVGNEFVTAWKYVPILLVAAVFAAISYYYGSLYGALKKSFNNMLSTVVSAISNFIINYIFINICGIFGAAIGTLVSYIVMAHYRMIDVGRYVDIRINKRQYIVNAIIVITQAIFVSLDIFGEVASGICVVVFLYNNRKIISVLLKKMKHKNFE